MIRKFSVTHTTNPLGGSGSSSDTTRESIASPTSIVESHGEDGKKLYAQSLESTENSVINGHTDGPLSTIDPLLYPIGSEHDTSTDEGLSMSEEEEISPDHVELNKLINDLDIDHKLKSAAQRGETELVKELLCNGAQVVIDENGSTAMHVAAQNGFAEVVRLLLEHGTDVDFPDTAGYTALHKAAGNGHLDVLELLINEGCDIDTQDDMYANTPLHEAAWNGFSKSVDLLLKNKSNAFVTNRAGCTPLHLAAQNGHNQSGRTLLYGGCSPDVKNNYGDTPLHTAARYGHAGIARILISAKCSITEQNKNGDTALHITSAFKRRKIAKLLVEASINTLTTNKQNETAVDIARRKDHPEIIEIIHQSASSTSAMPMYENSRQLDRKSNRPEFSQDFAVKTVDPKPDKTAKKKSHNTFVSWIRKKFQKKPNNPAKTSSGSHCLENEDASLYNNQYVKKNGFAYYRDLAGNIRQGPCGFVPACHCEPGTLPAHEEPPVIRKEINYVDLKESQKLLRGRMAELKLAAEKHKYNSTNDNIVGTQAPVGNTKDRQYYQTGSRDREQVDINKQLAQVENDLQELRGDLKTWLINQADDGMDPTMEENPFAYAIGASQMRFGDDFDHDRMARYDVTEQFPPPPRLFRSRSDETLSHSEYSYHGRAFKSKEAAMEELKTLKHHEELRARRRRIRAGGDEYIIPSYDQIDRSGSRSTLRQSKSNLSMREDNTRRSHSRRSKPNLWQSRENIRHDREVPSTSESTNNQHAVRSRNDETTLKPRITQINNMQSTNNDGHNVAVTTLPYSSHFNGSSTNDNGQRVSTTNQGKKISELENPYTTPANRYTTPVIDASRPPATYRLISAALNNPNNQIGGPQPTAKRPPIPAQRSHSGVTKRPIPSNTEMMNNRPQELTRGQNPEPVPFNRHPGPKQHNMLYSESQPVPSRQNHPDTLAANHRQPSDNRNSQSLQPSTSRRPLLPSYDEVQTHRNVNTGVTQSHPAMTRENLLSHSEPQHKQSQALYQKNSANVKMTSAPAQRHTLNVHDSLVPHAGESCCGSSNPDSGYGGQAYDFYANQPSPQQAGGANNQGVKEYDSWYSRRIQDAARKINTYTTLRPQRTMTSDV